MYELRVFSCKNTPGFVLQRSSYLQEWALGILFKSTFELSIYKN